LIACGVIEPIVGGVGQRTGRGHGRRQFLSQAFGAAPLSLEQRGVCIAVAGGATGDLWFSELRNWTFVPGALVDARSIQSP